MTRMMCRFCGEWFDKEDVSKPMGGGWVWMRDDCPKCHRGMDDWYISDILWNLSLPGIIRRATRYCRRAEQ